MIDRRRFGWRLPLAFAAWALLCGSPTSTQANDVYFRKDAEGLFHFSSVPGPGLRPFAIETERSADKDRVRGRRPGPRSRAKHSGGRQRAKDSRYDHLIQEIAEQRGVDPHLVKAIVRAESRFNARARSRSGARGLMQLMPRTARIFGVTDLYDPKQNIRAGVSYLKRMLNRFEDEALALAAYNAGPSRVVKYKGIPPFRQTQNYVDEVLRYRDRYREDDSGPTVVAATP